jgi:hypothetical protein
VEGAVKRLAIVVALAACGGREGAPTGPVDRAPRLQLLQCTPATRGPILADDGISFGGLTKAEILELKRGSRPGAAKLPRVVVGTPTTNVGGIDAVVLARVLRSELDKLRGCYDRELATNPLLAARIEIAFTIAADGRVVGASAGSKAPVMLGQCLSRVISGVRFPALPGGGSVRVTYPLTFDHGAPGLAPSQPEPAVVPESAPPEPWTPYSLEGMAPDASAVNVARLTERALRAKLDPIAACFTGPGPTGSLRAMLGVSAEGVVRRARIGGLADPASESCIANALVGLQVSTKIGEEEVACDLSRGDAQRWRVTPASYEVITTTRTSVTYRGRTVQLGANEPDALPANRTYLILVQPDTPGTVLETAISWAFEGDGTLIAMQGDGAAPVLLGMGRSTFALGDPDDDINAVDVSLEVDHTQLAACVRVDAQSAPLADAKAVREVLANLAARCKRMRCASTIGLTLEGGGTAGALAQMIDAVRHAGFPRVLIGGGIGCRAVKE